MYNDLLEARMKDGREGKNSDNLRKETENAAKICLCFPANRMVLVFLIILLLSLSYCLPGFTYYSSSDWTYWSGRRIEIETEEYESGDDLRMTIRWTASSGSSTPSVDDYDQAFSLRFSGMTAVAMLDDDGSDTWGWGARYRSQNMSQFNCYCNTTIEAKYLEPGELTIRSYFNGTNGNHTITIPEYDEPPAPVLTIDRTEAEVLVGESVIITGKLGQTGNEASTWFAVRTLKDGGMESIGTTRISGQMCEINDFFSSLPSSAVNNSAEYEYRLRYKDQDTGLWSAFSEPVIITVTQLGVIPQPEITLPESIPVDGEGLDVSISNPMEGIHYTISPWGGFIVDPTGDYSWHLSPYDTGSFMIDISASATGYPSVSEYYSLTVTEGNGEQPDAPMVDIVDYEEGLSMTFRITSPGMSEVYSSTTGQRSQLISGETLTIDFGSYTQSSASFRVKVDGKWSKQAQITFELIDSSRLRKPDVMVYTDENGAVPSGNDVYLLVKHVRNAARYCVRSYTTFYNMSSGFGLGYVDNNVIDIGATGKDLIVKIPGDKIHYRDNSISVYSYTNVYRVQVTAYPEEDSGLLESFTTETSFRTATETDTIRSPYEVESDQLPTEVLILPADLENIESEAFIGIDGPVTIWLPEGITFIDEDAFEMDQIMLIVQNDYAMNWAKDHEVFFCVQ